MSKGVKNTNNNNGNPFLDRLRQAGKDPNLLSEKTNLDSANDYSGLSVNRSGRASIPKRYESVGEKAKWNPFSLPEDMEREASLNQSNMEVFGNTVKGFATQALAGVVDSIAAYDMKGLYDLSVGNIEQKYGNWLNEIGKDLRQYSEDNHQIFQDGDSMWDMRYWAKQGQSLGYTGGIIAETIAEQAALAYLTGGSGNELGLASKARLLQTTGQGLFGMWKGVQEGYMNALETQQNVYQKYKQLGYDEASAQKKANEAATLGFRNEVGPLSALNALQFMTTFGVAKSAFTRGAGPNLGFSGSVETLIDRVLPNVTNKYGKAAIGFGVNAVSEGVEEGIQTGVSKYAQHETLKSTGDEQGDLNLWDSEMRDSVIGGMFGGALFAGMGKVFNKYTQGTASKQYSKAHDNFLQEAVTRTSNAFEQQQKVTQDYNKARDNFNSNKSKENFNKLQEATQRVKEAQYNSHLANTVNALKLDYINGKTTAFESHIEQMQNLLDAVNQGDLDTLKQYNIIGQDNKEKFPGAIDTIKDTFEQNIKDSNLIKSSLENNLLNVTSDFESAFDITKKEYLNSKQLGNISEYSTALNNMYSKDIQFNQLSSEGKNRFQLETELESFNRLDKLSEINKERKEELQKQLSDMNNYNSKDKVVVDSINKSSYVSAYTSIASTYQAIEDNNKELKSLRDTKNIQEKIKERTNTQVENAKSKEEVQEILDEAKDKGIVTPEMETIAENKKSELAAEETIKEVNPNFITQKEQEVKEESEDSADFEDFANKFASGIFTSGGAENFTPREFDKSKLSDDLKQQMKNSTDKYAKYLESVLERKPTFEDLINDRLSKTSLDNVDSTFNSYKYMWELSGRDISNAEKVYDKIFNPGDEFERLSQAPFVGNEELQEKTDKTINESIVDNSRTVEFDKDNRPIDKEGNYSKDGRTADPTPKASFLGIQYKEIKNADGTYTKQPVLAQLNESEQIKNHYVLDSDLIKEGTNLDVSIPQNVDNIKVANWTYNDSENKWVKSEITFGEWCKLKKATPGSTLYNNKVPMIANIGEDNIFFLHDTEWYNTSNVTGLDPISQKDNIRLGIENIKAVRNSILSGNTTIQVDQRNFGSLFKLNKLDNNNEAVSISEATGDTKLGIATSFNELGDATSSYSGTLNSKMKLVNNLDKNKLDIGVVYDIRHVNTLQDGTKEFIALPALTNDVSKGELLNDIAYNNSKFSIISSVILNAKGNSNILSQLESKYGMTLSKAETIRDSIKETSGIDIQYEISNYLNMFTQVDNQTTRMLTKLEDNSVKENGNLKFPTGMNYIAVDNNVIKIVNKDGSSIRRNDKGLDTLPGINLNNITEASLPHILKILDNNFNGNDGDFRKSKFNVSKEQLNKNKKFTLISNTGDVTNYNNNKHGENTYEGFVKDNLKTNVKSFPIKDIKGNTKWVTDVQPMIYYSVKGGEIIKPEISIEEKVQQAAQEAIQQIDDKEEQSIKTAIEALPDNLKEQLSKFKLGNEQEDDFFSPRELAKKEIEDIEDIKTNQISTLSPIEQKKLVNSLFNLVLSDTKIDNGTVSLSDIVSRINNSLETYLQPQINELKEYTGNLKKLNKPETQILIDNFESQISKLESIIDNKDKIVSNGSVTQKGDLFKKFERFLAEELTVTDDITEDSNGEMEYNYNMSSLEKDVKLTFSNNLKIFFANINKQNPKTRANITNFSYLNDYVDIDDVIQSLTEVMVGLPSSISDLISVLETKKENPIYNQILNKIKNSSEEIQNEILYKMIQSKLDMNMILYSFNRETKTYNLKVINPNSSSSDIKLKQQWVSDFINSDIFRTVNEERVYNKEVVNNLISEIDSLSKEPKLTLEHKNKLNSILNSLGITIGNNTLERLIETEGNNIFTSKGLLGVFKTSLRDILNKNKTIENINLDDSSNNPFENARGVVENLIDLELELNGTRVSKSFRVGSKSIQGAIQKMMVYDIKEQLKDTNSEFFKALKTIPYSKRNYILTLLESVPKFKDNFDVSFVSLEAIKQVKQKVYDDRKINKLATTDNMLTQYAFFQNTLRELGEVLPDTNLDFRLAHMFNPSLSDKEQMILYSTAVLDLSFKNFTLKADGTVELNDSVIDFMTEQLYSSEFDRIVNTYKNPTNIKNYDGAAKRFLSIPELNNIKSKEGASIHTVIAQASHDQDTVDSLREMFKSQAKDIIRETLRTELNNKVDVINQTGSWFDNGFVEVNESNKQYSINYFDSKYLQRKKGKNTGISEKHLSQMAAYDFIVNQFLNQNNTYQLIAGDMALYAPSIKKFTNKETKEIDNVGFSKAVGESITKRMAMLIAPGNKLANSMNDKYLQIFVNDPVKMTSTAREFIKQYYGSVSTENNELLESLALVENNIQNLYKSGRTNEKFDERLEELEESRAKTLKKLGDNNPEIGGYFDIEGTDAQEYTTWKEHMDILFRQGRLTSEEKKTLTSAYNKLEKGEDLDAQELSVVMNPIKPVYAGNNIFNDKEGNPNVNRIVYIKSSSFPLLPQLTKDFKLDKTRQQMEALQDKTGKNVRLSYQTANKVGAIATKLTTNDLYNIPFEELYKGKLGQSILELDRNNFKIQQDTPYKTAKFLKKNSDDMTTMGSQMWKIILGNNINKVEEKIFPNYFGEELLNVINNKLPIEDRVNPSNGMISGKDLDKIKFHSEKMYFDIQKEMLYDELGIDKTTGRPFDYNETTRLVNSLLQREVSTRQYPEGIIDNLDLVKDKDGNLQFALPIWLSTASNKFESLLQAIITNRLIQISLPGNQHISASSEGFEKVTSLEEMDSKIKSQVVWVNPNHSGELKTTIVDGKVKESEILVQSKFRKTYTDEKGKIKTKLIDLTKAPYSRMENGILVLNSDMIDDELLTNFSFRIPTSSHQSGAILKVVGFLPEASGDMVVVPKEHTKQIGEDFDIDKRTLYKSNYEIQENGKISKLNYSETDNKLEKLTYALLDVEYEEYLGTEEGKTKRASLKAKTKMLENAMIDVYKSVYTSPDNNIQKKINKILSFDNATETANLINKRINSTVDDKYFSIYSDDYQRQQMKLGADGKTGIGGHSNAVTLQAQMERLKDKIELTIPVYDEYGNKTGNIPDTVTIGSYTSDGILGRIETLDGERTIGDVHTENQNSATDNIKAQIMGKRNENPYTMSVLIQLTFRGFDMVPFTPRFEGQPNKVQVSSLFISQPILRRYVELKEQNKSITSDFDSNSENNIITKLVTEFGKGLNIKLSRDFNGNIIGSKLMSDEDYQRASARMTGDRLYDNLINEKDSKTWEADIQIATLQKFFKLQEEAKKLSEYQSLINLSTTGLGISYFNVLERINSLNDLGYEDEFKNIRDLVGDFVYYDSPENDGTLKKQGYTLLGDFFIKPSTTEGTVLVHSLRAARDIMNNLYFQYSDESVTGNSIKRILKIKETDRKLSKNAKLDLQYRIISAMRDYIYSNNLGFFEGDINDERKRLFFDTKTNMSLASYLRDLKLSKRNPLMYTNELLKSLNFDGIQQNGSPSIIKHQTDYNTNFDKTDKYNSFLELLQDDKTSLGVFNGIQMTPRKLAQDLATYAYLANNENGAIGFRDFINVKYLNVIGVSEKVRNISKYPNTDVFEQQFFQHNPEEAKIFSDTNTHIDDFVMVNPEANKHRNSALLADSKGERYSLSNFFNSLTEFTLEDNKYEYISFRDTTIKLSDNQYRLFKWDGAKYVRIPVLGTFGFNEYNPNDIQQKSLMYPKIGNDISLKDNSLKDNILSNNTNLTEVLNLDDGVRSLLEQIYTETENNNYKSFAEQLVPYIDDTVKIRVTEDINTGKYNKEENTIYLSNNMINYIANTTNEDIMNVVEEVVLEEIIHSITVNQLDKFGKVNEDGTFSPNSDAPAFIFKLTKLHEIAKEQLPDEYYTKNINEFIAGAFVSDEFKQKLDSTMSNGKTLYQIFKDSIAAMIRFIKGTSYSDETVKSVYELLKYNSLESTSNSISNPIELLKQEDTVEDIDMLGFMESGMFTSGGPEEFSNREFRLPEIKKCK